MADFRYKSSKPWKIDNIDLTQLLSLSIFTDFRCQTIKITWLLPMFIDWLLRAKWTIKCDARAELLLCSVGLLSHGTSLKLVHAFRRLCSFSKFRANRTKILNGPVRTKCPAKFLSHSKIGLVPCERSLSLSIPFFCSHCCHRHCC